MNCLQFMDELLASLVPTDAVKSDVYSLVYSPSWWLHASENPSSILCVVSGHLCTFHLIKTYFQALFILLCQIKHNHTIPLSVVM